MTGVVGVALTGWGDRRTSFAGAARNAVERATVFVKSNLSRANLACFSRRTGQPTNMNGKGDVFVLHFVAQALGDALDERERRRQVLRLLRVRRDGIWGYSFSAPVDSDDTALAIRTLVRLGVPPEDPVVTDAIEGLKRFRDPASQLYRTFLGGPSHIELVGRAPSSTGRDQTLAAWNYHAHPEVNANIQCLYAELGREADVDIATLWSNRRDEDLAYSFYYPDPSYSLTWLVPLALQRGTSHRARVEDVLGALRQRQRGDGSWDGDPLATAFALRALAYGNASSAERMRGLDWLVWAQQTSGAWHSSKPVWTFPHPSGDHWESSDESGVYTTAVVLSALAATASPDTAA
jgi:hypothetical protein